MSTQPTFAAQWAAVQQMLSEGAPLVAPARWAPSTGNASFHVSAVPVAQLTPREYAAIVQRVADVLTTRERNEPLIVWTSRAEELRADGVRMGYTVTLLDNILVTFQRVWIVTRGVAASIPPAPNGVFMHMHRADLGLVSDEYVAARMPTAALPPVPPANDAPASSRTSPPTERNPGTLRTRLAGRARPSQGEREQRVGPPPLPAHMAPPPMAAPSLQIDEEIMDLTPLPDSEPDVEVDTVPESSRRMVAVDELLVEMAVRAGTRTEGPRSARPPSRRFAPRPIKKK